MINPQQNIVRGTATPTLKPGVVRLPTAPSESSDTSQLHDAFQASTPAPVAEPTPVLREASGDMALMVDSMKAAEERMQQAGGDLERSVLQDLWAQRGSPNTPLVVLDEGPPPAVEYSPSIDGFLAAVVSESGPKKEAHPKENHGLLGGHLGIEGGEHLAHDLAQAKSHALETLTDAKQAAVEVSVAGGHEAVNTHGVAEVHHGSEAGEVAGHAATGWMAGLTGALAAGSGLLGAVMLGLGIKGVKHGLKHKDTEHTIEGANQIVVGTRSLAAGASMAGHLVHGSEVVATIAGVAKSTLTPLGVVHGAIDAGLGIKQVVDGVKAKSASKITKGSLGIGLGGALIAAACGGGIPAIVAAGVFLTGKIVHGVHERKAHARAEEHH